MKESFEEIRITDLDIDRTRPSQESPAFRQLCLKLSREPPQEWVRIFELERRFPPHPTGRKAWVEGAHIVIDCPPEELRIFHLNHLKEDVASANKKFLEWTDKNDAEILRQLAAKEADRKQLEELRAQLNFD